MALILITDNPQGGACRCEGQELDLASLSPEQVEALKQALGISETAGAVQELDINALFKAEIDPSVAFEGLPEFYELPSIFATNTRDVEVNTLANALLNLKDSHMSVFRAQRELEKRVYVVESNSQTLKSEVDSHRQTISVLSSVNVRGVERLLSTVVSDLIEKGVLERRKYNVEFGLG